MCWLFGFFSSSFLWNWYCSACLVLLWDFNYFNEFFGWFFSFSKMVNVSLNRNFILWNTAIVEVLFWDYTSMSWFLGTFFVLKSSIYCCKTWKLLTIYCLLIKFKFCETRKFRCFCYEVVVISVSWFWAVFTPWHFQCNIVRPESHLQSIHSLSNWNFMNLSFLLQLWCKAPWAVSLIECWPSLRTHAMSSSPSPSYVPHLVPEVFGHP